MKTVGFTLSDVVGNIKHHLPGTTAYQNARRERERKRKKVTKKLKNKMVDGELSEEESAKVDNSPSAKQKLKQKGFAAGKMEVFIKPKKKIKRKKIHRESEL